MKFLVIGCGYFGTQAAQLWRDLGHHIYVTSRSNKRVEQLEKRGFETVIADVTKPDTLTNLPDSDIVLFSVGFDRSSDDDIRTVYVDGFENVLKHLKHNVKQLIYVSSTGVLGSSDGQWIDESAVPAPSRIGGKAHLEAEQILAESPWKSRSTVLRLAGIYGPNRVPRLTAIANQQWHMLPANGHVNLIHVKDAAAIANRMVDLGLTNQLFHVSDGHPPKRKELYDLVASQLGSGPIDWNTPTDSMVALRSSSDKRISNKKLLTETEYQFLFPDYLSGVPDALRATKVEETS